MSTQISQYENAHAQSAMADLNAAHNQGHRRENSMQVGSFQNSQVYQSATKQQTPNPGLEGHFNTETGIVEHRKPRVQLQSASRTRVLQQAGLKALMPPQHDTSFSEQYKNFKSIGAQRRSGPTGHSLPTDIDMTRHVKKIVQQNAKNKPNLHRHLQRPVFAEEIMPINANMDETNVFKITSPKYTNSSNNYMAHNNTRSGHQIMYNHHGGQGQGIAGNAASHTLPPIGMIEPFSGANTQGTAFSVGSLNAKNEAMESNSNSAFMSPLPPRNPANVH